MTSPAPASASLCRDADTAVIDVIVAEDSEADYLLIGEALRTAGLDCRLLHAENGEQALRLIERIGQDLAPALIIIDINLPRYSGHELLARIRARPALAGLPVAVLSGSLNPGDRDAALAQGADLFIRKSSDLEEFLHSGVLIRELLARGRRA